MSDLSGEDELYVVAQDGTGKPEALTKGSQAFRYAPAWSPDGTRIAFGDKDGRVYVVKVADRTMTQIVDARARPDPGLHLGAARASPGVHDERHQRLQLDLRLEREGRPGPARDRSAVQRASRRRGIPTASTCSSPATASSRRSSRRVEFNFATNRTTGIFALALRKDVPHLFPPESDEVKIADEKKDDAEDRREEAGREEARGGSRGEEGRHAGGQEDDGAGAGGQRAGHRLRRPRRPRDARAARRPTTTTACRRRRRGLIYTVGGAGYYGRDSDRERSLRIFAFKDRKETSLVPEMSGYALSADGSKLIVAQGGRWRLRSYVTFDATPTGAGSKKTVSTAGLMYDRVPAEEWAQIFGEVWRRYRDFFYVENMHGYDWAALRTQYEPLVAHVAHRADLNTVIAEMIVGAHRPARLHRRRRHRAAAARAGGPARRPLRARHGDRQLPHRPHPQRPERGGALPLAADRSRRPGQGGRLRAGDRRRGAEADRGPVPPAAEQGRPARDADAQRDAVGDRRAHGHVPAAVERGEPGLPRLGADEPPARRRAVQGAGRLPARARHGRRRHPRVHQVVLRADRRRGPGGRRPRQRRRQRLADADRAPAPAGAGARLLAHGQPGEHLSGRRVPRADGRHPERELVVGRRHLPGDVPRGEAGAAGRPRSWGGVVGITEPRHAARRRHRQRAGVRLRHAPRASGRSRATASIPTSTSRTIRRRSSPAAIRSSSAPSPR